MERLPQRQSYRIRELVRRSYPRSRPNTTDLPEEYEARLRELERSRAAVYASMEDVADRISYAAELVSRNDDDAVPEDIEWTESEVRDVTELRERLRKGHRRPDSIVSG